MLSEQYYNSCLFGEVLYILTLKLIYYYNRYIGIPQLKKYPQRILSTKIQFNYLEIPMVSLLSTFVTRNRAKNICLSFQIHSEQNRYPKTAGQETKPKNLNQVFNELQSRVSLYVLRILLLFQLSFSILSNESNLLFQKNSLFQLQQPHGEFF